jgi:hypothetical protein
VEQTYEYQPWDELGISGSFPQARYLGPKGSPKNMMGIPVKLPFQQLPPQRRGHLPATNFSGRRRLAWGDGRLRPYDLDLDSPFSPAQLARQGGKLLFDFQSVPPVKK